MSEMRLGVVIPAAGASGRYNSGAGEGVGGSVLGRRSKLDEDLGGRPVLQRAVELFTALPETAAVVVAGPFDDEAFGDFSLRHADRLSLLGAVLCRGGETYRWQTVKAALAHLPDDVTHIAVHDAARPITPRDLIERVLDAARSHAAVIPAVPVTDTVKRLDAERTMEVGGDPLAAILGAGGGGEKLRVVRETLERDGLVLVQTPQVFERGVLLRAYGQDGLGGTDDAGLVERLFRESGDDRAVVVVPGDARNLKLTTPDELPVLRALGGFRPPAERATHMKF